MTTITKTAFADATCGATAFYGVPSEARKKFQENAANALLLAVPRGARGAELASAIRDLNDEVAIVTGTRDVKKDNLTRLSTILEVLRIVGWEGVDIYSPDGGGIVNATKNSLKAGRLGKEKTILAAKSAKSPKAFMEEVDPQEKRSNKSAASNKTPREKADTMAKALVAFCDKNGLDLDEVLATAKK